MIAGPRPSLGWLAMLVIGKSPSRVATLLGLVLLVAVVFIREARQTITLYYEQPGHYPPPTIILATADQGRLSPVDACGIESASAAVKLPATALIGFRTNKKWTPEHDKVKQILREMRNPLEKFKKKKKESKKKKEKKDEVHEEVEGGGDGKLKVEATNSENVKGSDSGSELKSKQINDNEGKTNDGRYGHNHNQPGEQNTKTHEDIYNEIKRDKEKAAKIIERMQLLENINEFIQLQEDVFNADRITLEEELDLRTDFSWTRSRVTRRTVSVYLWSTTIFSSDKWATLIDTLPGVQLSYLDQKKVLADTPLSSWGYRGALRSHPPWVSWAAAASALLWRAGGLLLPLGVVLTKPLAVTSVGGGKGALAEGEEAVPGMGVSVLGTPARHDILRAIMDKLVNDTHLLAAGNAAEAAAWQQPVALHSLQPLQPLLSEAVKEFCGTAELPYLFMSDCEDFTFIPGEEVVQVDMMEPRFTLPELGTLFQYSGRPSDLDDTVLVHDMFQKLRLAQFCPVVAAEVAVMASSKTDAL